MSIEDEANTNLELTGEDAENVVGGRMLPTKKAKPKKAKHSSPAFSTSVVVQAAPLGSTPAPGEPGSAEMDDPGPDGC